MSQNEGLAHHEPGGNVFISYSRHDLDFVHQIETLLEDEGYDPKIDRSDIEGTEQWLSRLQELISSSDTVVFILTDEYVASDNCRWEINEAITRNKRLIPVVPKPITSANVPEELSRLNYIYFFNLREGDGTGFYQGVKTFKRALRHDLERLRLLRRYHDRAEGWSKGEDDLLSDEQLLQAESWARASQAIEGVPADIARYIDASREAQTRREKRRRLTSTLIGTLTVAALVTSGFAGVAWMAAKAQKVEAEKAALNAEEAEQNLQLAQTDSRILGATAQRWAEASASLAIVRQAGFDAADFAVDPLSEAVGRLEQTYAEMQQLSDMDGEGVYLITNAVRSDLGEARYLSGAGNAVDPIDAIFANPLSFEGASPDDDDPVQADVSNGRLQAMAEAGVARAVYSCLDQGREGRADRRGMIADEFNKLPDAAYSFMSWSQLGARAGSEFMCVQAREAICARVADCPQEIERTLTAVKEKVPTERQVENAFQIKEVFIHIASEDDRAKAKTIAARLEQAYPQYRVLGIELVKSAEGKNRSIRYFYDPQADQARELASICAGLADENGFAAWGAVDSYRIISLAGRYKNLPTDRAEIWF